MATKLTSDDYRAMAARCQQRANETTKLVLPDAYRELAVQYVRLAVQQEAIKRCHALIGKFDADDDHIADGGEEIVAARDLGAGSGQFGRRTPVWGAKIDHRQTTDGLEYRDHTFHRSTHQS